MDHPSLKRFLDEGLSLAEIGRRVGLHEATVAYWVKKYGLEAANREKHSARGGIVRGELEELVEAGMSITEMANSLGRSKTTVRHWLLEYGLRTHRAQRRASIENGQQLGDIVVRDCVHHGLTEFKRRSSGSGHRCLKQFALSLRSARSITSLRAEAQKCVLLCANCHSEVEAGMLTLDMPARSSRRIP